MITYSAVLDCPWELFWFVYSLVHRRRRHLGTRRGARALSCHAQTKMVLRRLRDRPDLASLARDFGVSRATAQRYCAEGVDILAEQAPDLEDLIKRAAEEDWPFLIVDGTLIPGDRIAAKSAKHRAAVKLAEIRGEPPPPSGERKITEADLAPAPTPPATDPDTTADLDVPWAHDAPANPKPDKPAGKTKLALMANHYRADWRNDPNYSGKHHQTGMSVQVVCPPSGRLAYVSDCMPGRVYDSKAAEAAGLDVAFADLGIPVLSDLAYISITGWETPIKKIKSRDLTDDERDYNKDFAALRFAVERGISHFKGHWRILQYNRGAPPQTGQVARACLVLHQFLNGDHREPLRHASH